jgi:adenylate cyclase
MSRFVILFGAYFSFLLIMGGFIFYPTHLLETLRLKTEDTLFAVRSALSLSPRAPDEIVIVAIDDRSVHKIGRWPWNRHLLAKLIDNLDGAKLVALDIVFSEYQDKDADEHLAHSIKRHGRVVAGFFGRNDSKITLSVEAFDQLSISEYRNYTTVGNRLGISEVNSLNVNVEPILSAPMASAPFNATPDRDGLYRSYPIGTLYHGAYFCNLALQSWRYATGRDFEMTITEDGIKSFTEGNRTFTPISGQSLALNYYDSKSIKMISAIDVLEGRATEILKEKVVFLGVTEIGIYDMRPTPVDSVTPGVWLHYTAYGNMIDGSFLKQIPYINYFGSILLALGSFGLFWISKVRTRLLGYSSLFFGWLIFSTWMFIFKITIVALFYPLLTLLLLIAINEFLNIAFSESRIKDLRKAFSSYVSIELLDLITANPSMLKLGGEKKEITILFSDIRNFTSLSESMEPESLLSLLNSFLDPMTKEILKHGGMMDKYIGDAIMALYNVPLDQLEHEKAASRSALALMEVLARINREFHIHLDIGIGIHTGDAIIGNIGSQIRFDYTAIGDSVNLASRLEGLTKSYRANIILSENTANKLDETFLLRPLDKVRVKGKQESVFIYELMSLTSKNIDLVKRFKEALELYFSGDFTAALGIFNELMDDGPSEVMAKRCKHLSSNPPMEWDGSWTMTTK